MTKPESTRPAPQKGEPLWLELPAHNGKPPSRLLVVLHGAGSRPEAIAPVAIAWQFKFTSATAIILQGIDASSTGAGHDWFHPGAQGAQAAELAVASAAEVARRIAVAQQNLGIGPEKTIVVGFSQGGSIALELARISPACAAIVVSQAGKLHRPVAPGSVIPASIHLLHGEFDTQVPAQYATRAYRALREAGARVTLDVLADGIHSIDQDMINVGTTRAMQTIFSDRKRIHVNQFEAALAVSMDNNEVDSQAEETPGISKPH